MALATDDEARHCSRSMNAVAASHPVTQRLASSPADLRAVRDLLVRTYPLVPPDWNWEVRRWDGASFHTELPQQSALSRYGVALWEADGRVAAAAHSEDGGDAHFQLDPEYRELEPEMLDWAEAHLAKTVDVRTTLRVFVSDHDGARRELLLGRGYARLESGGWTRVVRFGRLPLPEAALGAPYRLATTSSATAAADAQRMAGLLNAAFGRTQHTAAEYLAFMRASPSFSHDLNLVALAADDSFAAHVGVTYEPANRMGVFEPVCTHPGHRRQGLARSLIFEGMRRLRALGAASACVGSGDAEAANALYRACGFSEEYHGSWFERLI